MGKGIYLLLSFAAPAVGAAVGVASAGDWLASWPLGIGFVVGIGFFTTWMLSESKEHH